MLEFRGLGIKIQGLGLMGADGESDFLSLL